MSSGIGFMERVPSNNLSSVGVFSMILQTSKKDDILKIYKKEKEYSSNLS